MNYAPDVKQSLTPEMIPISHDPIIPIMGQSPSYRTQFSNVDDFQHIQPGESFI
jgi:hypothetical protein